MMAHKSKIKWIYILQNTILITLQKTDIYILFLHLNEFCELNHL